MKTTIDIADELLRQAKAVASRESVTLREITEEGLRLALELRRNRDRKPVNYKPVVVGGNSGKRDIGWSEISDALYGGENSRGGESESH